MRNLSTQQRAALTARVISPAILVELTFNSGPSYIWTGTTPLTWDGKTFQGVGTLGKIGAITEATTVTAAGTSVTLSGIDPTLYADAMDDITTGLDARIWFACLAGNQVVASIVIFSGFIDQPTVTEGEDDISITLALETALTNLQRANRRLYTAAEQRQKWPNDNAFDWVTQLQDTVNQWG